MREDQEFLWYALYTRYKCEKHVAGQLGKKGIEAYIPLLTKTKRYTRKIKTYRIPLISCYVFVRINRDQFTRVLQTQYVTDFVRFEGKIAPIKEEEIHLLKRVVGEVTELQVQPRSWVTGDRVEIISGGLTGIQGVLVRSNGRNEFMIELDSLGYQMRMTVDTRMLRRLDVLEYVKQ